MVPTAHAPAPAAIFAALTLVISPIAVGQAPTSFLDRALAGTPNELFARLAGFGNLDSLSATQLEDLLEIIEALKLETPLPSMDGVVALHRHLIERRPDLIPRLQDWILTKSQSSTPLGLALQRDLLGKPDLNVPFLRRLFLQEGGAPNPPGQPFFLHLAEHDLAPAILEEPVAVNTLAGWCRQNYAAISILAEPTTATVERVGPFITESLLPIRPGVSFLEIIRTPLHETTSHPDALIALLMRLQAADPNHFANQLRLLETANGCGHENLARTSWINVLSDLDEAPGRTAAALPALIAGILAFGTDDEFKHFARLLPHLLAKTPELPPAPLLASVRFAARFERYQRAKEVYRLLLPSVATTLAEPQADPDLIVGWTELGLALGEPGAHRTLGPLVETLAKAEDDPLGDRSYLLDWINLLREGRTAHAALLATPTGNDTEWRINWRIGALSLDRFGLALPMPPSISDRSQDLLVLASRTERGFRPVQRMQGAHDKGSALITVPPGTEYIALQRPADFGVQRLSRPVSLAHPAPENVSLEEFATEFKQRRPDLRAVYYPDSGPSPGQDALRIGPLLADRITLEEISWKPGDELAITGWIRGDASISIAFGDDLAWKDPLPEHSLHGRGEAWAYAATKLLDGFGESTRARVEIRRPDGSLGPWWIDLAGLELRHKEAENPPAATLLGRLQNLGPPDCLAAFPDAPRVAVGFPDGTIAVMDSATGTVTHQRRISPFGIRALAGHGVRLYAVTNRNGLWSYDLATRTLRDFQSPGLRSDHILLSPDGTKLASWRKGSHDVSVFMVTPEIKFVREIFAPEFEAMSFDAEHLRIAALDQSWQFHFPSGLLETIPQPQVDSPLPERPLLQSRPDPYRKLSSRYFDFPTRHWVDPVNKCSYVARGRSVFAWGESPPAGRMRFPAGIRAATVRSSDGALLLTNRFGEIWHLPPCSELRENDR